MPLHFSERFIDAATPLLYTVTCIVLFAGVYRAMGVDKHFDLADDQKKRPWFASFYIATMAQTNAMGDATPRSIPARIVFALNTLSGFFWFLFMATLLGNSVQDVPIYWSDAVELLGKPS